MTLCQITMNVLLEIFLNLVRVHLHHDVMEKLLCQKNYWNLFYKNQYFQIVRNILEFYDLCTQQMNDKLLLYFVLPISANLNVLDIPLEFYKNGQ